MQLFKLINFIKELLSSNKREIVVYTAIFGEYDDLKDPPGELLKKCDFICFTNNKKLTSKYFKVIYVDNNGLDNHYCSRKYKILPHKFLLNYKYSIWIDASIQLKSFDIKKLIKRYIKKLKWAAVIHPERQCVYDEALACINLKKDNPITIEKQIIKYKKENYPHNNGLLANGFILRKHNDPEVIKLSELWWRELNKFSKRDQLSFGYIAWKINFKFNVINENLWDNQYFKVLRHNN